MCGVTTEYFVHCCTTYEYTRHVFVYPSHVCVLLLLPLCVSILLCCCAAACAAVRHRAPDNKICCCDPVHLIPVIFLLIQKRFMFYVPLDCTVLDLPYKYIHILGNYGQCAEPRRASAHRGEAPLVHRCFLASLCPRNLQKLWVWRIIWISQ